VKILFSFSTSLSQMVCDTWSPSLRMIRIKEQGIEHDAQNGAIAAMRLQGRLCCHNPRSSSERVLSKEPASAAIVLSLGSVRPLSTSTIVFLASPLWTER